MITSPQKAIWILLLCCGISSAQGKIKSVQSPKGMEQSTRPRLSATQTASSYVDLPIILPTGTNAYWCNLQSSRDLFQWTTIRSNVTGTVTVTNRGGNQFFRVELRTHP